ncbi:MAG: CcdB family protein [Geminicoccaceae bacterium]|nr:CcdB family protein [Geminicoccaceae bacterium]
MSVHSLHRFGRRLVLVVQHPFYDALPTRLVAPAVPLGETALLSDINPVVDLPGIGPAAVLLDQLTVVRAERLGRPLGAVDDGDRRVLAALDRLFCGV